MAKGLNAQQLRILITTDFFTPHRNGVAQFVEHLTRYCAPHHVTVLTYAQRGAPMREVHGHVTILRVAARSFFGDTLRVPAKTVSLEKHDLVITNTRFFTLSRVGKSLARGWDVPYIHVEHGNQHVPHSNIFVRLGAFAYDQTIGRSVLRNAAAVVCISEAGRAFVTRLGARPAAVHVIPNAIDPKAFRVPASRAAQLRQQLRVPVTDTLVLFVGRVVREKGLRELILALQGTDSTLVVVGDGPDRAACEKLAAARGVRIHCVGALPPSALAPYYAAADVFVNPSWAEGLPTTVLEAVAAGTPVIATDVGGTREIVPKACLVPARDSSALQLALSRRSKLPRVTLPRQFTSVAARASWHALLEQTVPKHRPFPASQPRSRRRVR